MNVHVEAKQFLLKPLQKCNSLLDAFVNMFLDKMALSDIIKLPDR